MPRWHEPAAVASARRLAASRLGKSWLPLGRVGAWRYNHELRRELSHGHALNTGRWAAIARDTRSDEVLFVSESGRLAAVHLTWKAENDARFPSTRLVLSLEEIAAADLEEEAYVARLIEGDPPDKLAGGSPVEVAVQCAQCGADWTHGESRPDCLTCNGFALTRPCPICAGRCGAIWQRAIQDSNDEGSAHWIGRCRDRPAARTDGVD